jgi:hypothetical protein
MGPVYRFFTHARIRVVLLSIGGSYRRLGYPAEWLTVCQGSPLNGYRPQQLHIQCTYMGA